MWIQLDKGPGGGQVAGIGWPGIKEGGGGIPPDVRGGLRARLSANSTVKITVAPEAFGEPGEGEGGEGWRGWCPDPGETAVFDVHVLDILTVPPPAPDPEITLRPYPLK